MEEFEATSNQPTLYGFYRTPALDVVTTWSETQKASLPARSHKACYYLRFSEHDAKHQNAAMNLFSHATGMGLFLKSRISNECFI